jgi:hypothetical protein
MSTMKTLTELELEKLSARLSPVRQRALTEKIESWMKGELTEGDVEKERIGLKNADMGELLEMARSLRGSKFEHIHVDIERRHDQFGFLKLFDDFESKTKAIEKDYFFKMRNLDSLAEEVFQAELAKWKRGTLTCSQLDKKLLYFSSKLVVTHSEQLNHKNKASTAFDFLPGRNHDTIKTIRMFSSNTSTKKIGLDWQNGRTELSESPFVGELEEIPVQLNKNEHVMQIHGTTGTYSADFAGMFTYTAFRNLWLWIIDMETLQCRIVECGCSARDTSSTFCSEGPMTRTACHIGGLNGTCNDVLYTVGAIYVPLAPDYHEKLQEYLGSYARFLAHRQACCAKQLSAF